MNIYTVSFFRHRTIDCETEIEYRLDNPFVGLMFFAQLYYTTKRRAWHYLFGMCQALFLVGGCNSSFFIDQLIVISSWPRSECKKQ